MNFICPVCGSKCDYDQAARDQLMREMIGLAAFFGKDWDLVNEYVDCFRLDQWGQVLSKKRVRLLEEVKRLFIVQTVEVDQKRYRADRTAITGALRSVCDLEKHGFRNHNYLKKVIVTNGAERVSAEGLTAKEERKRSEPQGPDSSIVTRHSSLPEERPMSAAEYKRRQGIKSLAATIGKEME